MIGSMVVGEYNARNRRRTMPGKVSPTEIVRSDEFGGKSTKLFLPVINGADCCLATPVS